MTLTDLLSAEMTSFPQSTQGCAYSKHSNNCSCWLRNLVPSLCPKFVLSPQLHFLPWEKGPCPIHLFCYTQPHFHSRKVLSSLYFPHKHLLNCLKWIKLFFSEQCLSFYNSPSQPAWQSQCTQGEVTSADPIITVKCVIPKHTAKLPPLLSVLPRRTPYIVNSLKILQRNRFPLGTSAKFWSILFPQEWTLILLVQIVSQATHMWAQKVPHSNLRAVL